MKRWPIVLAVVAFVAFVFTACAPPAPVKAAISAAGSQLLVVGSENDDPLAGLQADVDQLLKALTKG